MTTRYFFRSRSALGFKCSQFFFPRRQNKTRGCACEGEGALGRFMRVRTLWERERVFLRSLFLSLSPSLSLSFSLSLHFLSTALKVIVNSQGRPLPIPSIRFSSVPTTMHGASLSVQILKRVVFPQRKSYPSELADK